MMGGSSTNVLPNRTQHVRETARMELPVQLSIGREGVFVWKSIPLILSPHLQSEGALCGYSFIKTQPPATQLDVGFSKETRGLG